MTKRRYDQWRKSSHSDGGGNCVEVAQADDGTIGVRDSKNPTGPNLNLTPDVWGRFLTDVRAGVFDLPAE